MEVDDQDYPYFYDEEEEEEEAADRGVESEDDESSLERNNPPYTVMEESDIRQCQEHEISHVCSIIPLLSKSEASLLLCHYNWEGSKLVEEWFADEERVRSAVGLLMISSNKLTDQPKELTCGICFDECSEIYPVRCGHKYCLECWEGYIMNSINEGPGCLWLRCPDPSCRSAVDRDMVEKLVSEEGKRKYSRYLLRSYVENARKKKTVKWCTAPGCENAVKLNSGCSGGYDVFCACSHGFCWNCAEEAHRPVDCETVAKWVLKNSSEAENTEWILANSKPCPKCKRPIEKNHGCMHMTCTPPCSHHFCWLCLGDWSKHGAKTGGNYACNKYESEKRSGMHDEEERKRKCAKTSLRKYTHYYERWANNHKSRLKAVEDLNRMKREELKKLGEKVEEDVTNLDFVVEGWRQIIECRRVLTWSYTYGYYLPENEHGKIQLFECLQGQAENSLERLHSCAEKELNEKFIVSEGKLPEEADFTTFREKLTRLTKVTGTYFENLVRALENGLSEVDSERFRSTKTDDKFGANNGRGLNDLEYWYCDRCTYANPVAVSSCRICIHPRHGNRFIHPRHGNRFTMDEDD